MSTPIRATALAVVVTAVAGLTGCAGPVEPRLTSTPSDEQVSADLAPFYTQHLTWKPEGDNLDSTRVTVPVDWSHPDGATIAIAVARRSAPGTAAGSLIINPGGPGQSGVDFLTRGGDTAITGAVRDRYDLVSFDPRGVGLSSPVTCYRTTSENDAWLSGATNSAPGTGDWAAAEIASYTAHARACQENTGALLEHVDTASTARDMDVIRALLGDARITYLGYSYGTFLGATYASLFPDKVGRMVLDGAIGPEGPGHAWRVRQAAGFEAAFRLYLADCLRSAETCPFTGTEQDARDQAAKRIAAVDDRHGELDRRARARDGRLLTSAALVTAVTGNLYDRTTWSRVSELFTAVSRGQADEVFDAADTVNGRIDGTYTNTIDAQLAVLCNDRPQESGQLSADADLRDFVSASPTFGAYLSDGGALCGTWPYPPSDRPTIDAPTTGRALVIGTTDDPATPYPQAQSLADALRADLVTLQGYGHTAYGVNDCVNRAVERYLVDGRRPAPHTRCTT